MAIPLIFSFGRDWLVVSGVVNASSQGYQRARAWGKVAIEGWLPLVARLAAAVLALPLLWQAAPAFAPWQGGIAGMGIEGSTLLFGGLILLGLLAVVAVTLGAAGRVARWCWPPPRHWTLPSGGAGDSSILLLLVCCADRGAPGQRQVVPLAARRAAAARQGRRAPPMTLLRKNFWQWLLLALALGLLWLTLRTIPLTEVWAQLSQLRLGEIALLVARQPHGIGDL